MTKTVGRFSLEGDQLTGPAQYLQEQGDALVRRITAGQDEVFNMTAHLSPDIETAILVRLQTDFAGWRGLRITLASLEAAPVQRSSSRRCARVTRRSTSPRLAPR